MSQPPRRYLGALAFSLAAASLSHAQQPADVEEILVTAQKREQSAQDVPISISVFSAEQLSQLGIESTVELAAFTPGLTIGQNTGDGDFAFISLRGVTVRDFADTNESPSAVYLNEFYKANLIGLDQQVFDIQRVEVLRGPQGTLYGRNATGGLIHYVAAAPTREADAYASLLVGERSRYRFEGALSGPMGDTLSARLSVLHHEHDGWVENIFPGGEDGNALDATSVRGQLLVSPSDRSTFSLLAQYSTNDNEAGNMFQHVPVTVDPVTGLAVPNPGGAGFAGYIEPTPNDPRDTNSDRDIALETEQFTAIGRGEWQFSNFDVVSITGYEDTTKDGSSDSDATPFVRGTEVHPRADQFSQEIRLSGEREALAWVAGLYYFDYDIEGSQRRCRPASCNVLRNPVLYDLQTESWAAFGNVDFEFTPTLGLTTGVRYTQEKKEYELNNTDFGVVFSQATVGDLAKQDDDDVSFNVRLNWAPSDDGLG
ncbi:MAG: TonB-dependent receptor, partial [Armatimonadota bacterium]